MIDQRTTLLTAVAAAVVAETVPVATVFGIAIGVLLAAHAGAFFGLAHTPPHRWTQLFSLPPDQPRWKRSMSLTWRVVGLLFTTSSNAFAISWAVTLAPHVPLLAWMAKMPLAAAAGFLAYGSQYLIVPAFEAGQRWIEARQPRAGRKPR
jgi:hypothetical protein